MEEIIKAYMMERALVLVPALWIVGAVVKKRPLSPIGLFLHPARSRHRGGLVVVSADISGAIQGILASGWPYSDISSSSRPAKRQQTIPRRATDMGAPMIFINPGHGSDTGAVCGALSKRRLT